MPRAKTTLPRARPSAGGVSVYLLAFLAPHSPPPPGISRTQWAILLKWFSTTRFTAAWGDLASCPPSTPSSGAGFIFAGLGGNEIHPETLIKVASAISKMLAEWKINAVNVRVCGAKLNDAQTRTLAVALFTAAKSDPHQRGKPLPPIHWAIEGLDPNSEREARLVSAALIRSRKLANLSGNLAPPEFIANAAMKIARERHMNCEIWNPARLRKENCHALLAVAQGSANEPRLIILKHRVRPGGPKPLILVGKTITFDSGGLSLKPPKSMEWMKFDKCGGMAVLAAMEMIAALKIQRPVIGILAAAENMPGHRAMRPGDVIKSRSNKLIEVLNTDAEGRLVLADALSVACDFKPAAIVDFATLTGAAVAALGHVYSAVMGDDSVVASLKESGQRTGERVWPLPLHPDYAKAIRSPFADLKNTGDGAAGAIIGGIFLRAFVPRTIPWAHVDLTNAWEEKPSAFAAAGANLFGAQLALDWVRNFPK